MRILRECALVVKGDRVSTSLQYTTDFAWIRYYCPLMAALSRNDENQNKTGFPCRAPSMLLLHYCREVRWKGYDGSWNTKIQIPHKSQATALLGCIFSSSRDSPASVFRTPVRHSTDTYITAHIGLCTCTKMSSPSVIVASCTKFKTCKGLWRREN